MPVIEPPGGRAQALLRVINQQIQSGKIREGRPETFLSYSEALGLLGESYPTLYSGRRLQFRGLTPLNEWTVRNPELPKVAGLIVNKQSHRPGEGFFRSHNRKNDTDGRAWWMSQTSQAIHFDWSVYAGMVRYKRTAEDFALHTRKDTEEKLDVLRGRIDVSPAPAHLRESLVTVGEILSWFARGLSEAEILRDHKELNRDDIRASLAYAAEREGRSEEVERKLARLDRFTERWGGKFTLPKSAPDDPRMDYLVERYWRNRE